MTSTGPADIDKSDQLHIERLSIANEDGSIEASTFDKETEKRLLRKLDWHVVPILWLMFMLAFLDRTNVCTVFCIIGDNIRIRELIVWSRSVTPEFKA